MSRDSAQGIARFYTQALMLKLTPRSGWLQRGVVLPESVAEHSFGVALLALLISGSVPDVDRSKLLAIALLHDLAEVHITDLPASASKFLGKQAKSTAEREAFAALTAPLAQGQLYQLLWEEYTTSGSREARLIKALDRVELLAQTLAYETAGQRGLDEFWHGWNEGWEEFPLLAEIVVELAEQRPKAK